MVVQDDILTQVRSGNADSVLNALDKIRYQTTRTDLPLLYELVREPDWLVRDVAIEKFSILNEIVALPAIIRAMAMDRGHHDFDGVTEFTAWLIKEHTDEASRLLETLLTDSDGNVREMAKWWLEDVESM